ncbi:putative nucleosome assembly protein [Podosphaera aphanis]|nr:putative nucleosome assembly protein [Podosphaera aphanis]
MSEIPKKNSTTTAPTPQNTPANNAPISSHAQQPGVGTIKEAEELDRAAASSIFAQNPKLVQMIQGKLGSLVGRSSGYIESLPPDVRRRVAGLKGIQKKHAKLETQFQEAVLELEKSYFAKFTPLYIKRSRIVNGISEPTDEEIKDGESSDEDEVEKSDDKEKEPLDIKGIPEFWLSAMKNHISLADIITEKDEEVLKALIDVRMEYLVNRPGFKLVFEFGENEFFTNKTLTKTYFYQTENGYGGDFIYDHAEGDSIEWKEGKDLTVRVESKKQRNKNTKQTRVVKKTVPTESFFNFFSPPQPPENSNEEGSTSDVEERLELDYQLGEDVKEKLIPRAIDWFTGEALQYEEVDDDLVEGDFEDDDDEEDDEFNDDDEDESDNEDDTGKPKQETADCKQS